MTKKYEQGEGIEIFPTEKFLSHSTKKNRRGFVSQKFSGMQKNYGQEVWVSRFSVEVFLSHSAKKFQRRTPLCFKKTFLKKIFMRRRGALPFCRIILSHKAEKSLRGDTSA